MYEYLCDFEEFLSIYMLNSPSIFISRDQDGDRIFAKYVISTQISRVNIP